MPFSHSSLFLLLVHVMVLNILTIALIWGVVVDSDSEMEMQIARVC